MVAERESRSRPSVFAAAALAGAAVLLPLGGCGQRVGAAAGAPATGYYLREDGQRWVVTSDSQERIREVLRSKLKAPLKFDATPLGLVVTYLKDTYGIPIVLDHRIETEGAVNSQTPVTVNYENITLGSTVRLLLDELEMAYVVRDEVLFLTSKQAAKESLVTRVYYVGDLVGREQPYLPYAGDPEDADYGAQPTLP